VSATTPLERRLIPSLSLAKLAGRLRALADEVHVEADCRDDAHEPDDFLGFVEAELREAERIVERLRSECYAALEWKP
jgi:hypothetical protein